MLILNQWSTFLKKKEEPKHRNKSQESYYLAWFVTYDGCIIVARVIVATYSAVLLIAL